MWISFFLCHASSFQLVDGTWKARGASRMHKQCSSIMSGTREGIGPRGRLRQKQEENATHALRLTMSTPTAHKVQEYVFSGDCVQSTVPAANKWLGAKLDRQVLHEFLRNVTVCTGLGRPAPTSFANVRKGGTRPLRRRVCADQAHQRVNMDLSILPGRGGKHALRFGRGRQFEDQPGDRLLVELGMRYETAEVLKVLELTLSHHDLLRVAKTCM